MGLLLLVELMGGNPIDLCVPMQVNFRLTVTHNSSEARVSTPNDNASYIIFRCIELTSLSVIGLTTPPFFASYPDSRVQIAWPARYELRRASG